MRNGRKESAGRITCSLPPASDERKKAPDLEIQPAGFPGSHEFGEVSEQGSVDLFGKGSERILERIAPP